MATNLLTLLPTRDWIQSFTPWMRMALVTCFDQQNVSQGMWCDFWAEAAGDGMASLSPYSKQVQAGLVRKPCRRLQILPGQQAATCRTRGWGCAWPPSPSQVFSQLRPPETQADQHNCGDALSPNQPTRESRANKILVVLSPWILAWLHSHG